jgi:Flp pilus assembly protein TadD
MTVVKLTKACSSTLTFALILAGALHAEDTSIRINIPKRTKPTPVQTFNRDGVKAIEKHDYDKAKKLFYKAYLLDPNDPFTLNNLGYIAELEGDVEKAQRFYELSQEQNSEATVDRASLDEVKGKTVAQVAGHADSGNVQLNVLNVEAINLLNKDRVFEADKVLARALQLDPHNAFTLNNMGFCKEKEGELEEALRLYTDAANEHSTLPVIVTAKKDWRGRPISEIAAENGRKVRKALKNEDTVEAKVARLNQRGVSALNRNDRKTALELFQQAYKLDENDSFALNNMGYVAELNGDKESADYYYAKAREADNHDKRVTLASRREDEGKRLVEVAQKNDAKAEASLSAQQELHRRSGKAPVLLERRDRAPVDMTPAPQDEQDQIKKDEQQSGSPQNPH